MNSEELELSLRTEFENYLKSLRTGMRQEAVELRTEIEAEFDRQRSQLDETFQAYTSRFESEQGFDEAFTSSVVEHLRLARDEGSKLAANAMVEAEELSREVAAPTDFSGIRDAINDISSQGSQASILKSLVEQSAQFAPRGAFFIIKNEHLAGWKVFGSETDGAESVVREIHFPVASDTVLGNAVRTLAIHEAAFGAHADDPVFLDGLQFGQPDRMYAIPLVARGRGVAALYVDYGNSGLNVNVEALETLVRIAGLTVELLAWSHSAKGENREASASDFEDTHLETSPGTDTETAKYPPYQPEESEEEVPVASNDSIASETADFSEYSVSPAEIPTADFAFSEPVPEYDGFDAAESFSDDAETASYGDFETTQAELTEPAVSDHETEDFVNEFSPTDEFVDDDVPAYETGGAEIFTTGGSIEPAAAENSPFDQAAEFEPANAGVVSGTHQVSESPIDVSSTKTGRPRLSDRHVDLPIEVAEDERRLHNDARRFARLLVSEIKLYNEKKVQEGRQSRDLYERLREAIDRSREMYDKRVQPPVAEKFDYFHYELVNALAEGEADRLGAGYGGSRV